MPPDYDRAWRWMLTVSGGCTQQNVVDLMEESRLEGAAVAFGLMGMAEAIREEMWRYELCCEYCGCAVDVLRSPPYCDDICEMRADSTDSPSGEKK